MSNNIENPLLLSTETEYIVDAGNIHCKIVVNDIDGTIVNGGHCLKKFNGTKIETLRDWLYRKVDQQYKIVRQGKLGETL